MFINQSQRFNYTGGIQSLTLYPGTYKLECYGAGGGNDSQRGGYGGYSYGHIDITQQQTLYICVGGAGASAASGRGGGYNGGGNAGGSGSSGAGGGATHIALTNRGILSNYNSYRSEIILVAGAGGGGGFSGSNTIGGNGGGLSGQQAGASGIATQTSGNAFGQGGHRYGDGGGGGGGWYGGYAAAGDNGGGGGSSYYNTSKLYDYGTTSGVVPNTQSGYAIITCLNRPYYEKNENATFQYTGNVQQTILFAGKYRIDCYGAKGGNGYGNSSGGYGGHVAGYLIIARPSTAYLYCGQAGNNDNARRSSYNGGAIGGTDNLGGTENGGAGGGASDIRINGTTLSDRIAVAGGGGGAGGWSSSAGQPGGLGTSKTNVYNGSGTGTNGILGTGTNGITANSGGGGGGGGYYGGTTRGTQVVQYTVGCGAYGGSNYLNESIEYIISEAGICSGNGYITITCIQSGFGIFCNNCSSSPEYYLPMDEQQYSIITVPRTVTKNFLIYYFNVIQYNPNTVSIEKIDKYHYQLIIPANADYDINIDAIFDLPMRLNTDIYKDSKPQTLIEYESLLQLLEGE